MVGFWMPAGYIWSSWQRGVRPIWITMFGPYKTDFLTVGWEKIYIAVHFHADITQCDLALQIRAWIYKSTFVSVNLQGETVLLYIRDGLTTKYFCITVLVNSISWCENVFNVTNYFRGFSHLIVKRLTSTRF